MIETFERFARQHLPVFDSLGIRVEPLSPNLVRMRLPFNAASLRPGGTIAGPTMMALADVAFYGLLLTRDPGATEAVTTSMTINFLRRPEPADLIAEATLLKHGRRLAVGEVRIAAEGITEPLAHVVCTYALPPSPLRARTDAEVS
ncbi:MAG: PaaI family thioesterase [Alphaproteobacteria bacterium]|nr:PaaI family thioesterase [Alphaproteobacteria bacterium]